MLQSRIEKSQCNCHPETCCHFKYIAQILVDKWVSTDMKSDYEDELHKRIKQEHPSWKEKQDEIN